MERPVPYKGDQSYIFISYAHKDSALVWPVVDRMQKDGYRVWYDEGIDPGTEWDENIAAHVNGCSFFIAFLSENYLASDNCKDELNFARDQGKQRILVYLEDVELPQGMAMRLGRSQAIFYNRYADKEKFYEKLYDAQGIETFGPGARLKGRKLSGEQVQTVSQAGKKGLPRWLIPVGILAVAAIVIGAVMALGGGGKTPTGGGSAAASAQSSEQSGAALSDAVLADTDEVKVTVVRETGDSRYYGLTLSIENKTDQEIHLSLGDSYINGAKCDDSWYTYVDGGAVAEETIQWRWDDLASYGIDNVTAVEANLLGYYSDSYDDIPEIPLAYYPQGEDQVQYVEYVPGTDATILVEDDNFQAVMEQAYYDEYGDWVMDVVLINRSDRAVWFSLDDCFVNHYAMDPYWSVDLAAGKMTRSQVSVEDWKETGEEQVLLLEGILEVYDAESYDTWLTVPVEIYPEGESNAVFSEWSMDEDDVVVLENEYVQVVLTQVVSDSGDYTFYFHVVNLSQEYINVSFYYIAVNGTGNDGSYLPGLPAGTQCVKRVYWYGNGVEEALETLSFTVEVEGADYDQLSYENVSLEF